MRIESAKAKRDGVSSARRLSWRRGAQECSSGRGALPLIAFAFSWILSSSVATGATGDPLPDVDVSLDRKPGGFVKAVKPDAQGNFSFGLVSAGDYVITVRTIAPASPRQVANANPTAPGATAKSFFESRSNTAKAGAANPLRVQVFVSGASTSTAMRTVQLDTPQQTQISTRGGLLAGRITVQ